VNIFYLNEDAQISAQEQCDKHICKMTIEYCQLLSTAHRVLDGVDYYDETKNGRKIRRWLLPDEREIHLMKASHVNHPSNIWVRENDKNYRWMYKHFVATAKEYEYRYGRVHATYDKLNGYLWFAPKSINQTLRATEIPQCMPDHCKRDDVQEGYRNYYREEKKYFAKWTTREEPYWFSE
jgi:hypothetical protein